MYLHVLKYISPLNNSFPQNMKLSLLLLETGKSCCQKFYLLIPQRGCRLAGRKQEDVRTRTMGRKSKLAPSSPPTVCKALKSKLQNYCKLPSLTAGWNFHKRDTVTERTSLRNTLKSFSSVFIHSRSKNNLVNNLNVKKPKKHQKIPKPI